MTQPSDSDMQLARKARFVGIVLAVAMLAWMGLQWAGATYSWPSRFVFLFDFAALAAFIWAFVVTYQIWRKRRSNQG